MALNPGQALQIGSFDAALKGRTHVACGAGGLDAEVVASVKQCWLPNRSVIVLSDADFQQLSPSGGVSQTTYIGCDFTGWESHAGLRTALTTGLGDNTAGVMSRADDYDVSRRGVGLTMFIGVFIASLFFIAAGSLLYFKLFTELDEDRAQYGVLQDIGVTRNEVSRLVSDELGALFFVPLLIGAVHSGFALKTLANLFRSVGFTMSPFGPGLMIGGVYLAAQTIYYLVSARVYKRSVLQQG
jgi:putative ABC transport system permease protein